MSTQVPSQTQQSAASVVDEPGRVKRQRSSTPKKGTSSRKGASSTAKPRSTSRKGTSKSGNAAGRKRGASKTRETSVDGAAKRRKVAANGKRSSSRARKASVDVGDASVDGKVATPTVIVASDEKGITINSVTTAAVEAGQAGKKKRSKSAGKKTTLNEDDMWAQSANPKAITPHQPYRRMMQEALKKNPRTRNVRLGKSSIDLTRAAIEEASASLLEASKIVTGASGRQTISGTDIDVAENVQKRLKNDTSFTMVRREKKPKSGLSKKGQKTEGKSKTNGKAKNKKDKEAKQQDLSTPVATAEVPASAIAEAQKNE